MQTGGVDDHSGKAPADAIVHALGKHIILSGGIEVECAGIGPMPHNGKPVEQRNLVLLRHHPHVVRVGPIRNHDVGAGAVLHVHQNNVGAAFVQRLDPFIERLSELVGVDLLPREDGSWVVLELNGAVEFNEVYAPARDVYADAVGAVVRAATQITTQTGPDDMQPALTA